MKSLPVGMSIAHMPTGQRAKRTKETVPTLRAPLEIYLYLNNVQKYRTVAVVSGIHGSENLGKG